MPGFNGTGASGGPANNEGRLLRSYRWHIQQLGDIIGAGPDSELKRAKSVTFPKFSIGVEKYKSPSALNYKFAESVDWDDVTVIFYDSVSMYDRINQWYKQIWSPDEGLAPAENYKKDSIFVATGNAGTAIETFTLKNSFVVGVDHGTMSFDSNEMKILQVTLSYDYALYNDDASSSNSQQSDPGASSITGPSSNPNITFGPF